MDRAGNADFFRSIAESIPQLVWTTRPDGYHEYFNQRWLRYTGLTLSDAIGDG
jgi:PAS domain-containing protein